MNGRPQKTRVAAYGLIVDDGRILLCRVSPQEKGAGMWTLPGGGIDFGEAPEKAVVREVEEETGLLVKTTGLVTVDSLVGDYLHAVYHHVRVIYSAEVIGGALRNEADGSTDLCQWWLPGECPNLGELAEIGIRLAFR